MNIFLKGDAGLKMIENSEKVAFFKITFLESLYIKAYLGKNSG